MLPRGGNRCRIGKEEMAGAMGVKATMWIMAGVVMLLCGMSAGSAQAMSGEGDGN